MVGAKAASFLEAVAFCIEGAWAGMGRNWCKSRVAAVEHVADERKVIVGDGASGKIEFW